MMLPKKSEMIWVVVLVESGIPTLVEAYWDEESARTRAHTLSEEINSDYDEVGVFEVKVGTPSADY